MESFVSKQPYEEYYVDFDFVNVISSLDEINTAVVTAVDSNNQDVTTDILKANKQNIDDTKIFVWVQGGISGETYIITCRITTDTGEKYELEGILPVLEL